MSYTIRVDGKMQNGQTYSGLQTAINVADMTEGDKVEVIDEGADFARIVYTKPKGAARV